jgi:hypothetical protein
LPHVITFRVVVEGPPVFQARHSDEIEKGVIRADPLAPLSAEWLFERGVEVMGALLEVVFTDFTKMLLQSAISIARESSVGS